MKNYTTKCTKVTLLFHDSLGVIGVDESVRRGYCQDMKDTANVDSILTLAELAGMSTGIVTTARVTHASPSVLYAHSADRDWEYKTSIAKDNGTACKDIGKWESNSFRGRALEK